MPFLENGVEDELVWRAGHETVVATLRTGRREALDRGVSLKHNLFPLSPGKAVLGVIPCAGPLRK